MLSLRVSHQRTAPRRRYASQPTSSSSGVSPSLAPKPPPTSGAITRIASVPRPVTSASAARTPKGVCVVDQWVSRPSSPQAAAAARTSSGQGARRWLTMSRLTTTSQPSKNDGSSSPPTEAATLVPASGKSSTSPSSASLGCTTGGSGSYSTSISSVASTACSRDSATTTATGSPTKRTMPVASIGRAIASGTIPSPGLRSGSSPMSSPLSTSSTPGAASAAEVSMDSMRAWATGERTKARTAAPGRLTSST